VIIALLILRPGRSGGRWVMLAIAGVLAAEMFNTAVEHLVDHLHPEIIPDRGGEGLRARRVLIASLGAVAVMVALVVIYWGAKPEALRWRPARHMVKS